MMSSVAYALSQSEETIEVPSSLSGLSTFDFFPVFPWVFSPGVVMAPSHGFRLRWSGRLVASGSLELEAAQSVHSVLASSHFAVCAMRVGVPPCSLAHSLASCLITAGLASMDGPQLVSSDESQLCE